MTWTLPWAFTFLVGIYYVGGIVSKLTKGRFGQALFTVIVLLIGFWTGFIPADIVDTAQLRGLYAITNFAVTLHIGSSFDLDEIKKEWRIVVTVLVGIACMALGLFTLGTLLFDDMLVFGAFPVLVGGGIASMIMTDALSANGYGVIAALVVLVQSTQTLIGMPVIGFGAKMECDRLLKVYRGEDPEEYKKMQAERERMSAIKKSQGTPLVDRVPKKFGGMFFHLFLCAFWSCIAIEISNFTDPLTMGILGSGVVAIILGIIVRRAGLVTKEPLIQSGLYPFMMFALVTVVRSKLASLDFATFLANIVPILGMFAIGGICMFVGCYIVGRKLGYNLGMIIAYGFGIYCGYPFNYQVAMECIDAATEDENEKAFLRDHILQKVVIGSMTSVSITSVVIASIMSGFIH